MVCPKCKAQLPPGAVSCAKCGTRFKSKVCPYCKSQILFSSTVCPKCGKSLAQARAAAPSAGGQTYTVQSGGGFRWWYILIGLGIFILGFGIGYAARGGQSREGAAKKEPGISSTAESGTVDLDGQWEQTNKKSDTSYHVAVISGNIMEIYWLDAQADSRSLYWAGSVEIPEDGKSEFTWNSKNDSTKTEHAILASTDDTKAFSYKDGVITYEASAMGTTTTVKLEKAKSEIAGLKISDSGVDSQNADSSETPSQTPTALSIENAASILEIAVKQGFENNYAISTENDMIIISVWQDGVAQAVSMIQESGGDTDDPSWVNLKTSFLSAYESFDSLLETSGGSQYTVVLNALNDLNHENTLLTIANGVIVYDSLAE